MNNFVACPFCGSDLIEVSMKHVNKYDVFWAECSDCDSKGPICHGNSEAKMMWNKRINKKGNE